MFVKIIRIVPRSFPFGTIESGGGRKKKLWFASVDDEICVPENETDEPAYKKKFPILFATQKCHLWAGHFFK